MRLARRTIGGHWDGEQHGTRGRASAVSKGSGSSAVFPRSAAANAAAMGGGAPFALAKACSMRFFCCSLLVDCSISPLRLRALRSGYPGPRLIRARVRARCCQREADGKRVPEHCFRGILSSVRQRNPSGQPSASCFLVSYCTLAGIEGMYGALCHRIQLRVITVHQYDRSSRAESAARAPALFWHR